MLYIATFINFSLQRNYCAGDAAPDETVMKREMNVFCTVYKDNLSREQIIKEAVKGGNE